MKNKPKLQDALEVFYDKLENIEKGLKSLDDFEPTINSKIEELKTLEMNLNMEFVKEWEGIFVSNLSNWRAKILSRIEANVSHIEEINENTASMLETSRIQLEETNKSRRKKLTNFYIYTTIAVIIALGGMYFGIKKHVEGSQLKSRNSKLEYHNSSMFEFINEKEQTEEFNEWFDRE